MIVEIIVYTLYLFTLTSCRHFFAIPSVGGVPRYPVLIYLFCTTRLAAHSQPEEKESEVRRKFVNDSWQLLEFFIVEFFSCSKFYFTYVRRNINGTVLRLRVVDYLG